ncbi:MAG TPA: cyclic nucleotide-binding domain-containing protein [Myxococcaceae bacterium]|nr:cyclic nucleotide-binding domain-containing protein [Myxococcaceae bacterium]
MTTDLEALRHFLPRTPFFGGLRGEAIERLAGMLKQRDFPAGSYVFKEKDQGRSMFVVGTGELVAYQSVGDAKPVKLLRFRPGDFFGETTLIEMQPRPFSVVAEKDTTLYELTNMDLLHLYNEDVQSYVMVLQNINRELCRRLRKAGNRLTEVITEHPSEEEVTQIGDLRRR